MMRGKIALEEHFYLPSCEAYGADGSVLDGATKAHDYDPKYFAYRIAVGTSITGRAPAQIRTCGFPAYGSHLGCLTAKRSLGQG
jgi:hypothetical protein